MGHLGIEPRTAGWWVTTNPLSYYGGPTNIKVFWSLK